MGCGGSKAAAVAPHQTREAWHAEPGAKSTSTTGEEALKISPFNSEIVKREAFVKHKDDTSDLTGNDDCDGGIAARNVSAKSQLSTATKDSGLGDDHYSSGNSDKAITNSSETQSKETHTDKTLPTRNSPQTDSLAPPNTVRQTDPGTAQQQSQTPTPNALQLSESETDQLIRNRPQSRAGVAFKVELGTHSDAASSGVGRAPPAVLRRLRQQQQQGGGGDGGGGVTTREGLEEKQRAAQLRRKELEQQLVQRIQSKKEKERRMCEAMQAFISKQQQQQQQQQGEKNTGPQRDGGRGRGRGRERAGFKLRAAAGGGREEEEEGEGEREVYLKNLRNRLKEKSRDQEKGVKDEHTKPLNA